MRLSPLVLLGLLALLLWSRPVHAASSYDNCAGFITSVPAVISTPGTWCLKQDLTTAITGGSAIMISADNVALDCNDFRIDGSAGGSATFALGISGSQRSNVRIRHCNVRGFAQGVQMDSAGTGGRNVVEDSHFDGNIRIGVEMEGDGSVVRRNVILNTGSLSVVGTPFGIHIANTGTVDVINNTIDGVGSQCGTGQCGIGIVVETNSTTGANIVGNRIGGLLSTDSGADGIRILTPGRFDIRDNEITGGAGGSTGVNCLASTGAAMVRVHHNVIDGFATPFYLCADAGENDTSP